MLLPMKQIFGKSVAAEEPMVCMTHRWRKRDSNFESRPEKSGRSEPRYMDSRPLASPSRQSRRGTRSPDPFPSSEEAADFRSLAPHCFDAPPFRYSTVASMGRWVNEADWPQAKPSTGR
jgi:hypothetical protein